ncbi:hypothetical protein LSUE1_G000629 [Lachnellula suecica]|uniref:Chorismate mutase domain-containing protein n=1 Tax=Lachnellula suecica TaxID=602035 RepID=A0A8T9CGL9_9HELO|nr:hypothetical protein LSUE1_G000629 [Lachnellula suecica]
MILATPYLAFILTSLSSIAKADFASRCYSSPLPILTPNTENRTIPWGTPSFTLPNRTVCCYSLTQVRDGIDEVDDQLLALLAQRAAYVREATRFKATLNTVDVPARDAQVVAEAIAAANSTTPPLPEVVAGAVFMAILNSSVPFEECVFEAFEAEEGC